MREGEREPYRERESKIERMREKKKRVSEQTDRQTKRLSVSADNGDFNILTSPFHYYLQYVHLGRIWKQTVNRQSNNGITQGDGGDGVGSIGNNFLNQLDSD